MLSSFAGGQADIYVDQGDIIKVGESVQLEVLATPGHTDGELLAFNI